MKNEFPLLVMSTLDCLTLTCKLALLLTPQKTQLLSTHDRFRVSDVEVEKLHGIRNILVIKNGN